MKTINKLWILIAILVILTPVGIILPAYFKSGPAWGEWMAMDRYGKTNVTYIISAVIGAAIAVGITFLIGKFLGKKK
jgi:hypothetical protein